MLLLLLVFGADNAKMLMVLSSLICSIRSHAACSARLTVDCTSPVVLPGYAQDISFGLDHWLILNGLDSDPIAFF